MDTKNIVLGVVAGLATGTALGILFAPHKGKSTRKIITGKGAEYLCQMEKFLDDYVSMMNKKMASLTVEITDMSENIKSKAEDVISDTIIGKNKV